MSRRLGPLLAIGRTSEVYVWGPDRVAKVLRPGFPDGLGEEEARAGAVAAAAGIGAPAFFGTVRVDGRLALIYERIDGDSMLDRLVGRAHLTEPLAAELAAIHARIHAASGTGRLPPIRHWVAGAIERVSGGLPADLRAAVRRRLSELPDGDAVCHGDMHPGNVVLTARGSVVIDWLTAGAGPPALDVARTLFLLRDGVLPADLEPGRRGRIERLRAGFADGYLAAYRARRAIDEAEVGAWRLPILVARLDEEVAGEREHILELIRSEMP